MFFFFNSSVAKLKIIKATSGNTGKFGTRQKKACELCTQKAMLCSIPKRGITLQLVISSRVSQIMQCPHQTSKYQLAAKS